MTSPDDDVVGRFIEALRDDDVQILYDRAPCGYLSTTPDGTIIKVNATFLALTGHTREELIGRKRFVELLTAGGRIYHETHYSPMLRLHGTVREIALELVRADGSRLPALVNTTLDRDEAGNPVVIRTAVFEASHRRQYEEELLREKQRAEASEAHATALARTLQQTLIPPVLPTIAGLQVGAEYRPAGDGSLVGGDFYDIFQARDDEWVVVAGDVCGKGAEAAVVTALARYTLRAAAVQDPSPAHSLRLLNEALLRSETDRFCTATMLRLTAAGQSWKVVTSAAGHPSPLWVRDGPHVTAVGTPGSLLGVLDEVELSEQEITIEPGDALVIYTDGVSEARADNGDFFGEQRLLRSLTASADLAAAEMSAALLEDVLAFQNGHARDDIAIVALKAGPSGPVPARA